MTVKLKRGIKELIEEADAEIVALSPQEAAEAAKDENVLLVDIRDVRELQRDGVVPGAWHAPRGMLEFWVDPESPYHKPVFASGKRFIFFCAGGLRSALTTKTLQDMGLEPVAHVTGGFGAWRDAGLPVGEYQKKH
ncbi:MAG: rhodanese-like domain-containing protein [Zhengella sp.]|uniref:rhodanese-like domain-containing protein n=1 Tax=Zhengella sp. TaxID=2282762 RepID=UPI0035296FEA